MFQEFKQVLIGKYLETKNKIKSKMVFISGKIVAVKNNQRRAD